MFFIDTILDHLCIKNCFSEINTNPSYVDEKGRLIISPYVDFCSSPHGCNNPCPPNMCKGMIIKRIQASLANEGKKRMIYLGDGSGDFCPSLKLNEGDFVMPRKNFLVWDLICENRDLVKSEIHEWTDGEDLESVLLELIEMITIQESENSLTRLNYYQLIVSLRFQLQSMKLCPQSSEFISSGISNGS